MSRSPLRRAAGTALAVTALVASTLPLLAGTASAFAPDAPVFINEFHYDDDGTDAGEFVEVAGPAGTSVAGWTVVPYNGNGGAAYTPVGTLTGTFGDDTGTGYGFKAVSIAGLQNGAPDGLALVTAGGALVQFLSYEGAFAGTTGAANGVTSTDIGRLEVGTEPDGQSLQLTGTGNSYADFSWAAPAAATPGLANTGQRFVTSTGPSAPVASCPSTILAVEGERSETDVTASDADSRVTSATLATPTVGISVEDVRPSTADGQPATATVVVADTATVGTYPVQVDFGTDDGETASCAITVQVADRLLVSDVQGSGATSPHLDEAVSVEGVVTAVKTSNDAVSSFFLQEEDADRDSSDATSEGVLVTCGGPCPAGLGAGDVVRATGTVKEAFSVTSIDASAGRLEVSGTDDLPTPVAVALPATTPVTAATTFENVEGMLTRFAQTLTISEFFNLARFGELVLSADGRPRQYTDVDATPTTDEYNAYVADLAKRRIVLDDGSEDQNDAVSGPSSDEPYPYPAGGLSTTNRFRGGDTITGITGVMDYGFSTWRLQPVEGEDYAFASANPRPALPGDVGGRLKVSSANVLNYFATVDATVSTSSGPCGPTGGLDCRGADSQAELERQRAKTITVLKGIGADVFGLEEIQNDSGQATEQILTDLNAATAPGTYDYIRTGAIGTDAIKLGILYKPATVRPVGAYDTLTTSDDPRFLDNRNRPALIQTFEEISTGERFTVAVNHFKSKGSGCGVGDDATDGSGNCDLTRTNAAQALVDHLRTDPTGSGDPDFLVVGDLNAYRYERPIRTIVAGGFDDLVQRFIGPGAYSYLFDGQLGYLDHALSTTSLTSQVTGATEWHIDADEPVELDYNDTVKDVGESAFERESGARDLYAVDPYRSSDHDPVVVGLALASTPTTPVTPPVSPEPTAPATTPPTTAPPATTPPATVPPTTPATGAPADCTVAPRLSFPRSTVLAGTAADVVVQAPAGSTIDLFAYTQPSRVFRAVREAVVGTSGTTTFTVTPPANTRLYAQVRGCTTDAAADSRVLNVRTVISLLAKRNGPRDYTFSGDTLPARTGGLIVSLYRVTASGRQVLTAQTRASATNGEWSLRRVFTGTGRFGFVARTGQDVQNAPGTSSVRSTLIY